MYIELHSASAFSFLRGASLPEALVAPRSGLEEIRVQRADRRHVRGVEPDGAVLALVRVCLTLRDEQHDTQHCMLVSSRGLCVPYLFSVTGDTHIE